MGHHENDDRRDDDASEKGTVSEGGSGALNPDTSLGGADSVPDTPDVNTQVSDSVDTSEGGQERGKDGAQEGAPGTGR